MPTSRDLIKELISCTNLDLDTDIIVHNEKFYDRVFRDESLGLGESYLLGWWDAKGKTLDEIFYDVSKADLKNKLCEMSLVSKLTLGLNWLYNYFYPVKSIEDSKIVALRHYDLDRKLYESMLGNLMVYSCGYFMNENDTLERAQYNKMELIKEKLNVRPGMRILDIGCGWGELAAHLGGNNVYVDAITISREQYDYAKEKFEKENIKFHLQDYREFKPKYKYDVIVSVGMFEHVNSNNYEEFMKITNGFLKDQGLFLLHTIGSTKSVYVPDRWINKYIFPNSQLPSLAQITQSAEQLFVVEDVHNFGANYDKTLMCWHDNFVKNLDELNKKLTKPLNTEFYRMWKYYLLSCAGAFRSRKLQLYQVVLAKNPLVAYNRPVETKLSFSNNFSNQLENTSTHSSVSVFSELNDNFLIV